MGVRVPPSAPTDQLPQTRQSAPPSERVLADDIELEADDDEIHRLTDDLDGGVRFRRSGTSARDRASDSVKEASTRKLVLVVEDDEAVSSLLVALLEDSGYDAVPALDGRSALELAREHRPHLITLDLALPGTDGHKVLEGLKADPRTREIPVVVISAFTQVLPAGDRKKLAYLLGKPFDVSEVMAIVQATVGNPYV